MYGDCNVDRGEHVHDFVCPQMLHDFLCPQTIHDFVCLQTVHDFVCPQKSCVNFNNEL
jgi:hypothetical protein